MHQSRTLYVGLDVHKKWRAVAYSAPEFHAEVVALGTIGARHAIRPAHAQAAVENAPLVFVYEAGPCGDWL